MDPDAFDPARDLASYGGPPEGRLLASIMGHNPCLGWFGPPSAREAERGFTVHGEAPVAAWSMKAEHEPDGAARLTAHVSLPYAGLDVHRVFVPAKGGAVLRVETDVVNAGASPVSFGWQEHATFGPPFLAGDVTAFDMPAGWAVSYPETFAAAHRLRTGRDTAFTWPLAPGTSGPPVDLRVFPGGPPCGDFTAQLMDPGADWAWVTAVNPRLGLLAGYCWPRDEFPWVGLWDEHRDRMSPPWDGRTEARGIEFGLSPFPLGREAMRALGTLHGEEVLGSLPPGGRRSGTFFVYLAAVPPSCAGVERVTVEHEVIIARLRGGEELKLSCL